MWYHMVVGENFGEFGKSGEIHQNFTHPNLHMYIIKLHMGSLRNEWQIVWGNMHGWH